MPLEELQTPNRQKEKQTKHSNLQPLAYALTFSKTTMNYSQKCQKIHINLNM